MSRTSLRCLFSQPDLVGQIALMLRQYLVQRPLLYHHPPQLKEILNIYIPHHLDPAMLPGMPHSTEQVLTEAPGDD